MAVLVRRVGRYNERAARSWSRLDGFLLHFAVVVVVVTDRTFNGWASIVPSTVHATPPTEASVAG